jgi:DNA-binding winged helix-turn-helix (wHTH) protein
MDGRAISFGPFRLLAAQRLLLEGDRPVRLGSRAFDILAALLERADEVVGKKELLARVWPQIFVEDANLKIQISALRRALGDGQGGQRYVVTVPGRGYNFVAPVSLAEPSRAPPLPASAPAAAHNLPFAATRMIGRGGRGGGLLRHGRIYPTRSHWTRAHRRWLSEQRFDHAAQQIVFEELIQAVEQAQSRRDRLEQQMVALLPSWSLRGVVAALQALRGIALLSAITLMAEIGDFRRFANPRELMAWLGLVPREHSSGATTVRGAITKAGNRRARRILVEGAWTYRFPARIGLELLRRNRALPEAIKDVAWKAQVRLCARYRRLLRAGKPTAVVTVAIARELAAFVWAIATTVMPPQEPAA